MRLPLTIRTLADSFEDDENHVQGRIPANRNRAYGQGLSPMEGSRGCEDEPENDGIDDHQEERVEKRPEKAQHRPPVAGLELPADKGPDEEPVLVDFPQVSVVGIKIDIFINIQG